MSAVEGILLQKSFCITDCKFSGPYVRRSNNHLRDYIIERRTHGRLRQRPGGLYRSADPTVRNPRIETAIATPWGSKTALFASQDFPWLPHAIRRTKRRGRERNFRMERP